jgi:hypothetical protein
MLKSQNSKNNISSIQGLAIGGALFVVERLIHMAIIQNKLEIVISPTVKEVCAVISAVAAFHPGNEAQYLQGVRAAVNERLKELAADTPCEGQEAN